jgi:hypothetical protein
VQPFCSSISPLPSAARSLGSEGADVAVQDEGHVSPHLEGVPVEEHKDPPALDPATESQDWGDWSGKKTRTEILEEEMIAGLQQVPWRKVVSEDLFFRWGSALFALKWSPRVRIFHAEPKGVAVAFPIAHRLILVLRCARRQIYARSCVHCQSCRIV